ncbi:putative unusual protein kinase regulating ubiquinone biosynthesis (AarF/ABC1/UbiB family) [Leucobacter luti]|nr:putative unusual protein kinase regulating ubiquinone biosynthesis (AarF/ABC1/UbiB family) [Leucobacter luti]
MSADQLPHEGVAARSRVSGPRYRRILLFAGWHLVVTWWYEIALPKMGLARFAERTRSRRMQRIAQRFHGLAVELGGLMIKVGQFMSSRLDVLPPEITAELAGLQDEVAPVPFAELRELAEAELGAPLERVYASVCETPVAAASLGQVHRATLHAQDAADTGLRDVVVKVQRPGIGEIVAIDLAALRRVAGWLRRVRFISRRVDMPALVEEFATTSLEELDYRHEARSAARFAADFADNPRVAVPEIVWERSTRRVLTLEDVTAIKISDTAALRAAGIDPAAVAKEFATIMFDQLFTTGFFHADPHPGNMFVTPGRTSESGLGSNTDWKITFIDFGMMGEVPESMLAGLRKLLIAVGTRDGSALVAAIGDIGMLLPSADIPELERAMTQMFARFGGMAVSELQHVDPAELQSFASEFGDFTRSMPFQLPENFLLVIRTTSLTSGVCTALDPKFNLWDSAAPYATQLLRAEGSNLLGDIAQQAVAIARVSLRLPQRVDRLVTRIEDGSIAVSTPSLDRRIAKLERTARRLWSAVLFGGLLIAGAVLSASHHVLGATLMALSVLPLLHTLFSGRGPR